jgi:hypothetical protein
MKRWPSEGTWHPRAREVGIDLGLAAVAAITGYIDPASAPVIGFLAVVCGVLVFLLERLLEAVRETPTFPQPLPVIAESLAKIHDPWKRTVAEYSINRTDRVLRGLSGPNTSFANEDDLYKGLTNEIERLRPGDELFAVCADKSWGNKAVTAYLDANIRAAGNKVRIIRIFYQYSGQVIEEAERQAKAGIKACVVKYEHLGHLGPVNQVGPDLGIAIFNRRIVYIHAGLGKDSRAWKYDCAELAEVIRSLFSTVEQKVAEPVLGPADPIQTK